MDIAKILYEIIEEAVNGKVMLGDDTWPFYFNTVLEGTEFTNPNNLCQLVINNLDELIPLLAQYIELELNLGRKNIPYLDQRSKIKSCITYLFANATLKDLENPVEYVSRYIKYLKDNSLSEYDTPSNIPLNGILEGTQLSIERQTQSVMMETPHKIKLSINSIAYPELKYELPEISYAIVEEDGKKKCYIYSILNKEEFTGKKKTVNPDTEKFKKQVKRLLYKVNSNVDKYEEIDNISDVSVSAVLSLDLFLNLVKDKVDEIVAVPYLPIRFSSRYMNALDETDPEKKQEKEFFAIRLKNFFAEIIAAFQHFIDTIQVEIDRKVRKAEFEMKLRALYKELRDRKANGVTTVKVHDIWTMRDEYLNCTKELKKIAKKFSNVDYKHINQIDEDMEKFNQTMEQYKKTLEDASEKMVEVPVEKMITFIEDEVSGKGKVITSLNEAVTMLQQMQKDCDLLEKKKAIYGPDLIPRHVGCLRKVTLSITKFFKKWSVKIISTAAMLVVS